MHVCVVVLTWKIFLGKPHALVHSAVRVIRASQAEHFNESNAHLAMRPSQGSNLSIAPPSVSPHCELANYQLLTLWCTDSVDSIFVQWRKLSVSLDAPLWF